MVPDKDANNNSETRDQHQKDEWWDNIEEAAASSIKKGLKDAREGKTAAHESVMKKYAGWLVK